MKNKANRIFTPDELKEFNGESGKPTYVAYKGIVYDVSSSTLWTEGNHKGRHYAGDDSTEGMINAPHPDEVLTKFPIVGELGKEKQLRGKLIRGIEKLHLHSVFVHFSIAYSIFILILILLYFITSKISFETGSYYLLAAACLTNPLGALSGIFSWKVTYEGRTTKIFVRKIILAVVLTIISTACFIWRTVDPTLLLVETNIRFIYVGLITILIPLVIILGHYGGEIVYP